ncbi:MAG: class I tRNA ligase family protein [Polyangiaceae bacterium]
MSSEMPKAYEPAEVEPRWYQYWMDHGVFRASTEAGDQRPTYVVSMPPPNVTGSLHMGHALFGTIQDVLIRHKRMQGYNALWQPAWITRVSRPRQSWSASSSARTFTRHDLGRGVHRTRWKWKEERRPYPQADAGARLLC